MAPRFARSFFLASALAAGLAGCGGGGGSPGNTGGGGGGSTDGGGGSTPRSLAQYIGTWRFCQADTTSSIADVITLTAGAGSTVLNFSEAQSSYTSTDCSGTATGPATVVNSGSLTSAGTKTIGGETADKVDVTFTAGGSGTDLLIIRSDSKLYTGNTVADADGYPAGIDTTGYTRQ